MTLSYLYSLVLSVVHVHAGLELMMIFQSYLWGAKIIALPSYTRLSSFGTRVGITIWGMVGKYSTEVEWLG